MQIDGHTELIAHIGWPTHSFKAPMIYNPYFESVGVNAVVVPMGCGRSLPAVLRSLFTLENIRGALITMPHKVSVVDLLDEVTPTVKVAGACNAVRRNADGKLVGDMFDGEGFVRGCAQGPATARRARAGGRLRRRRLGHRGVAGRGGRVGAGAVRRPRGVMAGLAQRLRTHYPAIPSAPAATIRPAWTWPSTPRRWA
jgi:shikimate dehydrogenase